MKKPEFHTEAGIARREAEGRGQGDGANYLSWLRVPEFSSRGYRTMLYCPELGRVIHLFSLLEVLVFLFAISNPRFVQIKENYPLKRVLTRRIAAGLPNTRHPQVGEVDIVMTTDLFITEEFAVGRYRHLAWSTKYQDELRNPRPVEKLQIEQLYYEGPDAETPAQFRIMTAEKLPQPLLHNLRYVRGTLHPGAMAEYDQSQIAAIDAFMRPHLETRPLNCLSAECDQALGLTGALRVARYLIATRKWPVDMEIAIDPFVPLKLTTTS